MSAQDEIRRYAGRRVRDRLLTYAKAAEDAMQTLLRDVSSGATRTAVINMVHDNAPLALDDVAALEPEVAYRLFVDATEEAVARELLSTLEVK